MDEKNTLVDPSTLFKTPQESLGAGSDIEHSAPTKQRGN